MELLDISHNDDLRTVAQKCNMNFKNLAFGSTQSVKRQGRESANESSQALTQAIEELVNVTIPNEVSSQIQRLDIQQLIHREVELQIGALDIQGAIDTAIQNADIPTQVSQEVANQMPDAYPPVGSYVMMMTSPASSYDGTTWSQVDMITTDGNVSVPLWQRTT